MGSQRVRHDWMTNNFIFTIFTSCDMPAQMTHTLESRWKNINNLRYADDTTLMAESEEELKSLWTMMKEEHEKGGLKLNIQNTKIIQSCHFMASKWGKKMETVTYFISLGSKITMDCDCSHEIKRHFLLGRKSMTNLVKWVKLLSRVLLFVTPWTVAYQAPLPMGFSRQEYWSGLPFPSPEYLPKPGTEPRSPTL